MLLHAHFSRGLSTPRAINFRLMRVGKTMTSPLMRNNAAYELLFSMLIRSTSKCPAGVGCRPSYWCDPVWELGQQGWEGGGDGEGWVKQLCCHSNINHFAGITRTLKLELITKALIGLNLPQCCVHMLYLIEAFHNLWLVTDGIARCTLYM